MVEQKTTPATQKPTYKKVLKVPRNVFFLALTSLFQDLSGEMIFTIMPLFLANVLGVATSVIGLITGISDSTSSLLKLAGGWLADRSGKRKALTTLGYSISTVAKPFLYFANGWGIVLAVRFTDRIGKGVRTAPRDALIAASTSSTDRGRSFGFHRALDTLGAVFGLAGAALIVYLLERGNLGLTRPAFQMLVLVGLVPGVIAVIMVAVFVREVNGSRSRGISSAGEATQVSAKGWLNRRFKLFLAVVVLFSLGNSSDAFLILRAQDLGLSVFHVLLVLVAFNIVYAGVSTPAGVLSDKLGRRGIIAAGWAFYGAVYLGFAVASAWWHVLALFALYGVYQGLTNGVLSAYVADVAPPEKRGTAYGWYHGLVGISLLPASLIAGYLWQKINPAAPFFFASALSLLAATAFLTLFPGRGKAR
ncbi:MAG: MFS transporter [Chloroflexi bacterium]|nr:MFS transporter [Chloroflexota bacterium]